MCPVGFVDEAFHPRFMCHADDGPQITADAVIRRIVHEDGNRIRMLPDSPGHGFALHPEGDADPRIHVRIDIDRDRATKNERVDDALVDIPGEDDLITPFADRQDHALD